LALMLGMPTESLIVGTIVLISLIIVYQFLRKEPRVTERKLFEN
jgi:hypothetical protein